VHKDVLEQICVAFGNLKMAEIKFAIGHTAECVSKRQSMSSRDIGWS
jgi:hypothetical protein